MAARPKRIQAKFVSIRPAVRRDSLTSMRLHVNMYPFAGSFLSGNSSEIRSFYHCEQCSTAGQQEVNLDD